MTIFDRVKKRKVEQRKCRVNLITGFEKTYHRVPQLTKKRGKKLLKTVKKKHVKKSTVNGQEGRAPRVDQ